MLHCHFLFHDLSYPKCFHRHLYFPDLNLYLDLKLHWYLDCHFDFVPVVGEDGLEEVVVVVVVVAFPLHCDVGLLNVVEEEGASWSVVNMAGDSHSDSLTYPLLVDHLCS